jgi:hypothetical protein
MSKYNLVPRLLILSMLPWVVACTASTPKSTVTNSDANGSNQVIVRNRDRSKITIKARVNPFPGSIVKTETIPARPFSRANDKPDYAIPQHIRLTFVGGNYSSPSKEENDRPSTFYPLEINIYPVAEYRKTFSLAPDLVAAIDRNLAQIKNIIQRKKMDSFDRIPYLLFHDGSQNFAIHKKWIDFRGGKGFAFLTHTSVDIVSLVANRALTYIYQGLTDDGRYYIFASFPVSAEGLPRDNETKVHDGFSVVENFSGRAQAQRKYRAYLNRVSRRLARLPPDKFSPSLTQVEKIIRSLEIEYSSPITERGQYPDNRRSSLDRIGFPLYRIDRNAIDIQAPVEMRPGHRTRTADAADGVAGVEHIPFFDFDFAQM